MGQLPEPHPLDFDWRYSKATVRAIAALLPTDALVLSVGAPSLARYLLHANREVLLIDRQPFQCVKNHLAVDIDAFTAYQSGARVAIIDPPWYPNEIRTWAAWAGNCVGRDGALFVSVWPSGTRPNERQEYEELLTWFAGWSQVEELDLQPHYEVPAFEIAAADLASNIDLSRSPRVGRLLHVRVYEPCAVPVLQSKPDLWHRFVFNEYQLAIRIKGRTETQLDFNRLPGLEDWQWPFVSRRAPGRDLIDIWSSKNEVATATTTIPIITALRNLASAIDRRSREDALSNIPQLMQWHLPHPPFWRTFEWRHQQ